MTLRRRGLVVQIAATVAVAALLGFGASLALQQPARAAASPYPATPKASCGKSDVPEPTQGQPAASPSGFRCNLVELAHIGPAASYSMSAFGHCAYYDTPFTSGNGVQVVDVSDPLHPAVTETLTTPGMRYPHEGLRVNPARHLLAALGAGAEAMPDAFATPFLDIYDVGEDCAHPQLLGSNLVPGAAGHEAAFSPDGKTFYTSGTTDESGWLAAIDVSDPANAKVIWTGVSLASHGLNVSPDGKRLYLAQPSANGSGPPSVFDQGSPGNGLVIMDVSQIQSRQANPQVSVVGSVYWPDGSLAQVPFPFTSHGKPYVLFTDEAGSCGLVGGLTGVGASNCIGSHGRIIDISDEAHPTVISQLVLQAQLQGTSGFHYCSLDRQVDPTVVGCTAWEGNQGFRVFDIRDVYHPREIAYYSVPGNTPASQSYFFPSGPDGPMAWYTDMSYGFYVVKFTNGVWPFSSSSPASGVLGVRAVATALPNTSAGGGVGASWLPAAAVALVVMGGAIGVAVARRRRLRLRA